MTEPIRFYTYLFKVEIEFESSRVGGGGDFKSKWEEGRMQPSDTATTCSTTSRRCVTNEIWGGGRGWGGEAMIPGDGK